MKDCLEEHREDPGFSAECKEEFEIMMEARAADFRCAPPGTSQVLLSVQVRSSVASGLSSARMLSSAELQQMRCSSLPAIPLMKGCIDIAPPGLAQRLTASVDWAC